MSFNETIARGPLQEQVNREIRDSRTEPRTRLKRPQDLYSEPRLRDNVSYFAEGSHENVEVKAPDSELSGLPGAEVKNLSIYADCRVSGIYCTGTVIVYDGHTAIFDRCVFDGPVVYRTTAVGHIIGSLFRLASQVTNVAPGQVFIIGCSRKSGLAHAGVTVIAETT